MRLFITLFLLTQILLGKELAFVEEKYLYALDTSFTKRGTIVIANESLTITYEDSNKKFLYQDDTLTIQDSEEKKVIDLTKDLKTKLFFSLILAVFHEDFDSLEEFFSLSKDKGIVTLLPKGVIGGYVTSVQYKKSHKLDFLKIELTNQDRITIEERI